jgi:hypothetical protein
MNQAFSVPAEKIITILDRCDSATSGTENGSNGEARRCQACLLLE